MRADGEKEGIRESHRGMRDRCRWNGGGMGYKFSACVRKRGRDKVEY